MSWPTEEEMFLENDGNDDINLNLFHTVMYTVQSHPLSSRDFSISVKTASSNTVK
jgi:hypothetical protein